MCLSKEKETRPLHMKLDAQSEEIALTFIFLAESLKVHMRSSSVRAASRWPALISLSTYTFHRSKRLTPPTTNTQANDVRPPTSSTQMHERC